MLEDKYLLLLHINVLSVYFSGVFDLHVLVDNLFFIGSQLVALSSTGKVGVWHSMTQHWQVCRN